MQAKKKTTLKQYPCITLPSKMFSQRTSINWFLSVRLCSCQNPTACINSCMTVTLSLHVDPIDTSCPWLSTQNLLPTVDQHLNKTTKAHTRRLNRQLKYKTDPYTCTIQLENNRNQAPHVHPRPNLSGKSSPIMRSLSSQMKRTVRSWNFLVLNIRALPTRETSNPCNYTRTKTLREDSGMIYKLALRCQESDYELLD